MPEASHVYRKTFASSVNTTPAGVEDWFAANFYKHANPLDLIQT